MDVLTICMLIILCYANNKTSIYLFHRWRAIRAQIYKCSVIQVEPHTSRDLRYLEATWHQILEHSIWIVFCCSCLDLRHIIRAVLCNRVLGDVRIIGVDPRIVFAYAGCECIDFGDMRRDCVSEKGIICFIRP
jgi:hypothetical protein